MKLQHFTTQEFVPKRIYKERKYKAIQLISYDLLHFIQSLRLALNLPITLNDWHVGGVYQYRGLRTTESEDYTPYSMHTFGKALDFKVSGMTAQEVRDWIIEHRDLDWVKPITFIEDAVSWVHVDVRPTTLDRDLWLYNVFTKTNKVYKRS